MGQHNRLTRIKEKLNIRIVVLAAVLFTLALFFAVPSVRNRVSSVIVIILEWTQSLGAWAPLVVIALYVVACIFMIPGSPLTIGAGFVFEILFGVIIVSIASTIGACAAFLVGRTVARGWVEEKIVSNPKVAALDEAVGKQGLKIVFLARLSPVIPFAALNYGFSVTKVKLWQYALASWVGMIPGTLLYVYIGAGLRSLSEVAAGEVETGLTGRIFFWFGMVATVAVTIFLTMLARNTLRNIVPAASEGSTDSPD